MDAATSPRAGGGKRKAPAAKNKKAAARSGSPPSEDLSESVGDIEDQALDLSGAKLPEEDARRIADSLVAWYDENKRDLPWRDTGRWSSHAYAVWVSEIMLQQTRVATVIDYFTRWMARWPTVEALAAASEEEVNEMWAGLGYYRRARMLHSGAKALVEHHGARLPETPEGLKSIPGIGEYTAGAVSSIAFGRRAPLVDGNVVRVLSRLRALAGDPKAASAVKAHWALARALVETQARPGDLNQGLMELGATRADPALPVTRFPAKAKKAAAREERVAVCVLSCAGAVKREGAAASEPRFLLVQRPPDGLLAGLWEFPSVPLQAGASPEECAAALAAYLGRAAALQAGAGGAGGGASAEAGAELAARIAEGCAGETEFLFSHIRQTMCVFRLHVEGGPAALGIADASGAAVQEAQEAPAKGKVKGGKGSAPIGQDAAAGAKGASRLTASPPHTVRWLPESELAGAALPAVMRKVQALLASGGRGSSKRRRAVPVGQQTLSHFFLPSAKKEGK